MIELDRLNKLREQRLSNQGQKQSSGSSPLFGDLDKLKEQRLSSIQEQTQDSPSGSADDLEKLKEERLNRLAQVAQHVTDPEKANTPPPVEASWWDKTKEFLTKNPDPIQYIKDKVSDAGGVGKIAENIGGAIKDVAENTPIAKSIKEGSLAPLFTNEERDKKIAELETPEQKDLRKQIDENHQQMLDQGGILGFGVKDPEKAKQLAEQNLALRDQYDKLKSPEFVAFDAENAKEDSANMATAVMGEAGAIRKGVGEIVNAAIERGAGKATIESIIKHEGNLAKVIAKSKDTNIISDAARLANVPEESIPLTSRILKNVSDPKDVDAILKEYAPVKPTVTATKEAIQAADDAERDSVVGEMNKLYESKKYNPTDDEYVSDFLKRAETGKATKDEVSEASKYLKEEHGIDPLISKPALKTEQVATEEIPKSEFEFKPKEELHIKEGEFDPAKYVAEKEAAAEAARKSEKGPLMQRMKDGYSIFKSKIANNQSPIFDVLNKSEKEFKFDILPSQDYRNQFAKAVRASEQTHLFTEKSGFDKIVQSLSDEDFKNFNQYLQAKRSNELAFKGIEAGRDVNSDLKLVKAFKDKYEPIAQELKNVQKQFRDYLVDSGLASREHINMLEKENPDYVPFNRIFNDEEVDRMVTGLGKKANAGLNKQTIIRKINGSDRQVENVFDSMWEQFNLAFQQGEKSKAGKIISKYEKIPGNPFGLKPYRTAENVNRRIEIFSEMKGMRKESDKLNRLINVRSKWARRLKSELNKLNKEGIEQYLKRKAPKENPRIASIEAKYKYVQKYKGDIETAQKEVKSLVKQEADEMWKHVNGVIDHKDEYGRLTSRSSENPDWYRNFYKEHGRAPGKRAVLEMAEEALAKGKGMLSEPYSHAVNDLELLKKDASGWYPEVKSLKTNTVELSRKETKKIVNELINIEPSKVAALKKQIATRDSKLSKVFDILDEMKAKAEGIKGKRGDLMDEASLIRDIESKGQSAFSFYNNGVKETWGIDPRYENALKNLDPQDLGILEGLVRIPMRVLKIGTTGIKASFTMANAAVDQLTGFINSNHALRSSVLNPKNFVESLANTFKKGEVMKQIAEESGSYTSFDPFRNPGKYNIEKIRAGRSIPSKIKYTLKHPSELFRALEDIVAKSEEFTRTQQALGTRAGELAAGRTEKDATILGAKAYRENTVDFMVHGDTGKVINSLLAYFNPGIRGAATLIKNLKNKPLATSLKIAATTMLPMAYLTSWNLSDEKRREAYNDIPDWEKESNVIFIPPNPTKNPDGTWNVIKVKIPQEVASLTIPLRRTIEQIYGQDPVKASEVFGPLLQTVTSMDLSSPEKAASTLTPQVMKPSLEIYANKKFYTGGPVVPDNMKDLAPEAQFNTNRTKSGAERTPTSGTIKILAGKLGLSPMKTEFWLRETFGGVTNDIINGVDKAMAGMGVISKDEIGGKGMLDSVAARFNAAAGGASNQEKYTTRDEKVKELSKIADPEDRTVAIQEYISSLPREERQGALFNLSQKGLDTKGVSTSDAVVKMKPVYQHVQELVAQGKEAEARAIVHKLSADDYEGYKKARASAISAKTKENKVAVSPKVEQIKKMVEQGNTAGARQLISAMTDDEYKAYQLVKKQLGYKF